MSRRAFPTAAIIVEIASFALCEGASASGGDLVLFNGSAAPHTILIRTSERRLYLVMEGGQALRYTVGVGRAERQWAGQATIAAKFMRPNWAPPAAVKLDQPTLPDVVSSGAPNNPLGAAALTLSGSDYAIHGTNAPKSVGGFVSYGCIRMFNEDIIDLYNRVDVGTPVLVTR